jgi:hypothetical protein
VTGGEAVRLWVSSCCKMIVGEPVSTTQLISLLCIQYEVYMLKRPQVFHSSALSDGWAMELSATCCAQYGCTYVLSCQTLCMLCTAAHALTYAHAMPTHHGYVCWEFVLAVWVWNCFARCAPEPSCPSFSISHRCVSQRAVCDMEGDGCVGWIWCWRPSKRGENL